METYKTLLNRFDKVLIENEELKAELKELKEVINNNINLSNKRGQNGAK